MRQPDIEIYLKDASQQAVADWLAEAVGPCSPWQQKGKTFKCKAGNIPVTWLPNAVGKWHSLLLESDTTPWEDDILCARAAFAALDVDPLRPWRLAGRRSRRRSRPLDQHQRARRRGNPLAHGLTTRRRL